MDQNQIHTSTVTAGPATGESHLHHGRNDFEVDMRILRLQLGAMSGRCRDQLHRALEAFRSGSGEKAADVCESDHRIDWDEKNIDGLILRVLALRQPVASELRRLTASLKVVTDLERIGDEAVDIARAIGTAFGPLKPVPEVLWQLAEKAENMVDCAVRSYLSEDGERASQVLDDDATVRALHGRVLEELVNGIVHGAEVAPALRCLQVARCLERTGWHATNIAIGTQFVLGHGEMPR